MFTDCVNLKTIYAGDWNTDNVEYSYVMFYLCNNLIGGQGTTYDEAHISHAYARIDGGKEAPGYFTYKATSGIQGITGEKNTKTSYIYNLSGQRIPTPKKGVNIINGRKYWRK